MFLYNFFDLFLKASIFSISSKFLNWALLRFGLFFSSSSLFSPIQTFFFKWRLNAASRSLNFYIWSSIRSTVFQPACHLPPFAFHTWHKFCHPKEAKKQKFSYSWKKWKMPQTWHRWYVETAAYSFISLLCTIGN